MKKLLVIVMVFVFAAISSAATAQMKVALVDIQRCANESEVGKKVQAELRKTAMERESQFKAQQDELAKMQKEFIDQEKVLSEAAKKKRTEEMQAKYLELNENARRFEAEMQKKERDAAEKLEPEIQAVIATVAKNEKIDIVFFKQAVLYAPKAEDITQKVIDMYNKQQPK